MSIDQWLGLAVLATLFALEGVIPFYDQASGRWSHAARNIGLALMAGLVGAVRRLLVCWFHGQPFGLDAGCNSSSGFRMAGIQRR